MKSELLKLEQVQEAEEVLPSPLDEFDRPLTRYEKQKIIGVRRENGALKLKRLSNKHYKIIAMHLQGWSGGAIAVQLNCSQITISRILNDPLTREILTQAAEDTKGEIEALIPKAVNVVRAGLNSNSLTNQFRAVDKLEKLKNMTDSAPVEQTAEDLVQDLLSRGINFNITVNQGPRELEVPGRVIEQED